MPVTAAGEQLVQGQKTVTAADVGTNTRTRRAGGRASKPTPCRVVVDVREFMSSLPAVLHQQGMQLVPVQLEVGRAAGYPSQACAVTIVCDHMETAAHDKAMYVIIPQ